MTRSLLRLAPFPGVLALLLLWGAPAAHSGASGAYLEAERPPCEDCEPTGGSHTCHVCRRARVAGVKLTPAYRPVVHRCISHIPALNALRPQGLVLAHRLEHASFVLDVEGLEHVEETVRGRHGESTFDVEFRLGDHVLGRVPVRMPDYTMPIPIVVPPELQAKLRGLRGRITWGVFGTELPMATNSFFIEPLPKEVEHQLAGIDRALARDPAWLKHTVRAQAWMEAGFLLRAFDEVKAALALRPSEPHATVLLALLHQRLGYEGTVEQHRSKRALIELYRALKTAPTVRGAGGEACRLRDPFPRSVSRRARPRGGC